MAYPYIVFVYGKHSIQGDIIALIQKYSNDYKLLHDLGDPCEIKVRLTEASDIALLHRDVERLGANVRLSGRLEGYGVSAIPAVVVTT